MPLFHDDNIDQKAYWEMTHNGFYLACVFFPMWKRMFVQKNLIPIKLKGKLHVGYMTGPGHLYHVMMQYKRAEQV